MPDEECYLKKETQSQAWWHTDEPQGSGGKGGQIAESSRMTGVS